MHFSKGEIIQYAQKKKCYESWLMSLEGDLQLLRNYIYAYTFANNTSFIPLSSLFSVTILSFFFCKHKM